LTDPLYSIAYAAADLKRAAPDFYEKLVDAVKAYENRCLQDLLVADPGVLLGAQQKAWVVAQLRQRFENCIALRDQGEKRK
jgi:hypothetical protein